MAEIILPPEENEETPQVPELNIDKPTDNSKVITIEFEAKKTNKVSTKDTNQQLYTTDTDAWFEFKETSLEGANGTYSVVFRNRHDGSIFQRTGDVVNGVAYYKIPHQEIRHAGAWRGQIVYTLSNGDTTSREFGYDVKGHILDGKDVREIVVEDFETLMSQLRSMKDNAEVELANLVNTANQNETDRQAFFDDLVEDIDGLQANYQELLDTGVLQTNINTKLEALEEEYAPKLTEVTAQLAQNELSLADKVKSINQANYSEMFKNTDFTHSGVIKRSGTEIELFSQNDFEGVRYILTKDPNDDFFKLGTGGFYNNQEIIEPTTQGSGWVKSGINWYTTNIGDSFTIEYEGTGIDLRYFRDSRGGVWDLNIDGELVTISTFSMDSDTISKIIRHPFDSKKITGVFKGKDPDSEVETPRGWIRSTPIARGTLERAGLFDLLHEESNKEIAFRISYQGNPSIWYPEHSGIGVMYDNVFTFHVDNVNVTNAVNNGDLVIGNTITVQQSMVGRDNISNDNIADFTIQHSINKNGVIDYRGVMRPLTTFLMRTGYPLMLATKGDALNKVVTSYGNSMVNSGDDSEYFFTDENGEATSVLFTTNLSGYGSFVAHATLNEATKTMLYGQEGTTAPEDSLFFWQRLNVPKFYFQSIRDKEFTVGDVYNWSGTIGVGRHQSISSYM